MVGQTGTKKRNRDVEKSEIHKHLLSDHLKVNNLTYKKKGERSNGDSTNERMWPPQLKPITQQKLLRNCS